MVAEKSKVGPMFAWFQRLLPKTGGFFELFEAHAVAVLAAADATGRLFQGGPKCHQHIREIREREHDADEIVREMLTTTRQTFLTPFDRGAITALIGAMDDAIDEMQSAASAVDVYQMTQFDAPMRDMVAIAVDAARLVAEAMPLMRDVAKNGARLHELTERLIRMEGHGDEIHTAGLKSAFQTYRETSPIDFAVRRRSTSIWSGSSTPSKMLRTRLIASSSTTPEARGPTMHELAFPLLVGLVILALAFDFLNGLHDAANSIATVVATKLLRPSRQSRLRPSSTSQLIS